MRKELSTKVTERSDRLERKLRKLESKSASYASSPFIGLISRSYTSIGGELISSRIFEDLRRKHEKRVEKMSAECKSKIDKLEASFNESVNLLVEGYDRLVPDMFKIICWRISHSDTFLVGLSVCCCLDTWKDLLLFLLICR